MILSNNIRIPEIKFLNISCAPNANATPNKPRPANTGPILIPQVSRMATIARKLINILKNLPTKLKALL